MVLLVLVFTATGLHPLLQFLLSVRSKQALVSQPCFHQSVSRRVAAQLPGSDAAIGQLASGDEVGGGVEKTKQHAAADSVVPAFYLSCTISSRVLFLGNRG